MHTLSAVVCVCVRVFVCKQIQFLFSHLNSNKKWKQQKKINELKKVPDWQLFLIENK